MTGYQNFNASNVNLNDSCRVGCKGREVRREKSAYDRLLDFCCMLVAFFEKKSVKNAVAAVSAITFLVGVFLLVCSALRGEIGYVAAVAASLLIAVISALGIRYSTKA